MEIVLTNRARGNERDASVALENGPFDLIEPFETDFVHRRKNVFWRDPLTIEAFFDQHAVLDQDPGARLHDVRESLASIARGTRDKNEREKGRRPDDSVRHRIVLASESTRKKLGNEEQRD